MQVPIQDNRKGTGNRRCTHNKHMGTAALFPEAFSLTHTETMLFVSNDKRKFLKRYLILNQGMGSNHKIHTAIGNLLIGFLFGFGSHGSG